MRITSSWHVVGLLYCCTHEAFSFTTPSHTKSWSALTRLNADKDPDLNWATKQREECTDLISRIDTLQVEIQSYDDLEQLESKRSDVDGLARDARLQLSELMPPAGLSMEEYKASIRLFVALPPSIRLALVNALDFDESVCRDVSMVPEIITRLYEKRQQMTPKLLADSLKEAQATRSVGLVPVASDATPQSAEEALLLLLNETDTEEAGIERRIKEFYPRVMRQEDRAVEPQDLEVLTNAFNNSIFTASGRPFEIPGGYIIRGSNQKSSGKELIEVLDSKLPSDWDCTVCYISDMTIVEPETILDGPGNALMLVKKEFPPALSSWVYGITSTVSACTLVLFCLGVYGSNDAVLNQLTDTSALGDFSGLDWFSGKVGQLMAPILVILACREAGHIIVSKSEKFEMTTLFPTFMPVFGNLPLLGTLTRLKTSPRNFTALFDYAFLGSLLGFVSSFIFLGSGLIATKAAVDGDANAAQFLPALPVSVLRLSTLGSSVVDNFFAGGDGFITAQDAKTAVPLHPFAIAGYVGILMSAAEMLPLGATDGGRLSTSIFGREGAAIVGGLTWLALLIASFTLEDQQTALLITAWATNNISQNDMEIPCRDESENTGLARSLAAFGLWFLALLTITPL